MSAKGISCCGFILIGIARVQRLSRIEGGVHEIARVVSVLRLFQKYRALLSMCETNQADAQNKEYDELPHDLIPGFTLDGCAV